MALHFWQIDVSDEGRPTNEAVAHIIVASGPWETPGGTETEEDIAACGKMQLGYGIRPLLEHNGSLEEATRLGVPICPRCSDIMRKHGYKPDGSDFSGCRSNSNIGLLPSQIDGYMEQAARFLRGRL